MGLSGKPSGQISQLGPITFRHVPITFLYVPPAFFKMLF